MTFGIIGYGSIAKKHIHAIFAMDPNAGILLLRHTAGSTGKSQDSEGYETTSDYNALQKADVILITNPTSLHYDTILKVTDFKKPLFIEKPLSHTMTGIPELAGKLKEKGIINYVACNLRFHSCMDYLKNTLLPGLTINEVNIYCGSYLPGWRPGADFRASYSASENMGGGVHLDLIHELDYCYYLFGAPKRQFNARTSRSSLEIEAADYAHYFWQYDNFSAQITLNYFRRDYKRTLEIVAEDATYTVDFKSCTVKKENDLIFSGDPDLNNMYQRQMAYFIGQVQKGEPCFNDVAEAALVLNLCIHES